MILISGWKPQPRYGFAAAVVASSISSLENTACTSSKSSKLVHGGIRYLQQGEVGLVYEALAERQRLLQNAPHLVKKLPDGVRFARSCIAHHQNVACFKTLRNPVAWAKGQPPQKAILEAQTETDAVRLCATPAE